MVYFLLKILLINSKAKSTRFMRGPFHFRYTNFTHIYEVHVMPRLIKQVFFISCIICIDHSLLSKMIFSASQLNEILCKTSSYAFMQFCLSAVTNINIFSILGIDNTPGGQGLTTKMPPHVGKLIRRICAPSLSLDH